MAVHRLAGQPVPASMRGNIPALTSAYYTHQATAPVGFGTSGHRGSSLKGSFQESHILATTQAIVERRAMDGYTGPSFVGMDTHALSTAAHTSAIEVFAANGVETVIAADGEFTPTPVISERILNHNAGKNSKLADGIVITPSHNPWDDGGFKYNPANGGPASKEVTDWIQNRANEIMNNDLKDVKRMPYERALQARNVHQADFITPFITELGTVIDMDAIASEGIHIGADPMGGAGVNFYGRIADMYGLNLEVVNPNVDPTFSFMTLDKDGKIRMDCSSPYAMASLIALAKAYDIAVANDPDFDRHGIVDKNDPNGVMNPNHYLAVAINYLLQNRPGWGNVKIGKTIVSSSMIDKVVAGLGRELYEVPVGFKWFVDGLANGWLGFGGEESAGASMLRMDGRTWTTDKDGFALALLAAEIMAKTGRSPAEHYKTLTDQYGNPYYSRDDRTIEDLELATKQRAILKNINPQDLVGKTIAGMEVVSATNIAPGNKANMGGIVGKLKDGSWFAIRFSGTEPKVKVYAESYSGEEVWADIIEEAPQVVFG